MDPDLYNAFQKCMNEYQTLGHMVLAPEAGGYFILHHALIKANGDLSKICLYLMLLPCLRLVVC